MLNPEIIMFADPLITAVNIVLIVGIIFAVFAAVQIRKGNQELHVKNLASRRRLFGNHKS